mgnify:CR=1 FL=1
MAFLTLTVSVSIVQQLSVKIDKNIWCYDSYEGFQPLKETTYKYTGVERHTPAFKYGAKGPLGISLEEVKNNFDQPYQCHNQPLYQNKHLK